MEEPILEARLWKPQRFQTEFSHPKYMPKEILICGRDKVG